MAKFLALAAVAASAAAQVEVVNVIDTARVVHKFICHLLLPRSSLLSPPPPSRNRQRDQRGTYVTGIRYTSSGCGASWIAPKVLHAAAGGRASFGWVALLDGTKDGERIKIVQQTMHHKFNEDDTMDDAFSTFDTESKVAPVKVKSGPRYRVDQAQNEQGHLVHTRRTANVGLPLRQ
ncbi:hypothetical protein H310_07848 [Aphanomyces invadans]|uniref:Uncharacterized protein n=1 Tax=Aphanomyces invadans TaxID=157072 RepID=A0A024U1P3_9STRA|nr:hypothetical protein H310_07848 [Aphanomyces invadans]ETV99806.1 hypothetical protein H310_07848 [Aphanomyces invadans]|eukprot:XP_008871582.1 hypothetical protein H310_07848 [Aphanomyces invadans]